MKITHCIVISVLLITPGYLLSQSEDFDFTDVTFQARVAGATLAGGHGIAWADIDNDGDLDFFVANTPSTTFFRNYLFINNGRGKFSEEAIERGVAGEDEGSHAAVFADLDNDGDYDLLVSNSGLQAGPGQNRVYVNKGDGYFVDRTEVAGLLGDLFRTRGIGVGDFNNDGYLDFIVTNGVPDTDGVPESPVLAPRMYINKGKNNPRFRTAVGGLTHVGFTNGISVYDVDKDGRVDVLESLRAAGTIDGITHRLWMNIGDARFKDSSEAIGENYHKDPENLQGNGISLGDLDNDGDLDMITVASDGVRVFRNNGGIDFEEVTAITGIESNAYTAAIGDLNHDGYQDIIIADLYATYNVWENNGDWTFTRHADSGIAPPAFNDPRAISLADYDGDGDLDVGLVHKLNRIQLFRNNLNNDRWIKVGVDLPNGQRGGFGSKIYLYPAGELDNEEEMLAYREVTGTSGYLNQNAPEAHFGLPAGIDAVDVRVIFPDGTRASAKDVQRGRAVYIRF